MLPIRMKAADTRASSAIADWMALTSMPRSSTTAEIETFMIDVSTTSTNIAIASRIGSASTGRRGRWGLCLHRGGHESTVIRTSRAPGLHIIEALAPCFRSAT